MSDRAATQPRPPGRAVSRTVAAIDLGGTAMKGAVSPELGALEHAESRPTGREDGPEAVLDRLARFAEDLAGALGQPVGAVGVAVPGLVDEAAGVARASVNLGWRDVPLRERLRQRLGVPVAVAHDVRAAARAEAAIGAARGCEDWLLVTLGTGVGAAVVIGGRPFGGAHGTGGELGHVVVAPDGPACGCGARGCVESLASAGAVERRFGAGVSARDVVERAAPGEPAAARVWRDAVEALAAGLAAYVVVMDPERIVVGGGLADAGAALFDPLARALKRRLTFVAAPPVVPAALGPDAGCHGAAIVAREAVQ
jgi:glucokinase